MLFRASRGLVAIVVVFLGLNGCQGPTLPPGAQAFVPGSVYERWWAWTEACSGRTGDFDSVKWYFVQGSGVAVDGQSVSAYWSPRGNAVIVAEPYLDNGLAIRHEMAHALLRTSEHPRAQFLGTCAGIVDCTEPCAQSAEAWTAPVGLVIMPPDSLLLESQAQVRREDDGQAFVELSVQVTNPTSHFLIVSIPGASRFPSTFAFDMRGPEGGISSSTAGADSSTFVFAPAETKTWLYEFRVDTQLTRYTVPPGDYVVRGGYGKRWTAWHPLNVQR
jgi:hypothetical protein